MSCPSCGFNEWKLVTFVYEQGLHNVNLSSGSLGGSVGSSGLNVGIGSSDTTGTVQCKLSDRAKPPKNYLSEVIGVAFVFAGLLAGMVGGIWLFQSLSFFYVIVLAIVCAIIGAIAGVWMGIWVYSTFCPTHETKHKSELEAWNKRRMCLRCGTFYDPV